MKNTPRIFQASGFRLRPHPAKRGEPLESRTLRLNLFFLLCLLISALWFPASGRAACFNPAGNAGDLRYNGGYGVYQYCNGGAWIGIGKVSNLTGGLVGWWKLDDGSGTSAADSSGTGNTGTTHASPTWTTSGMNGGALTFNGTTQYVSVAPGTNFMGAGEVTVSAWVYPTANTSYRGIFESYNSSGPGTAPYIDFELNNGANKAFCSNSQGSSAITSTASSVPLNQWTHVACVRSADGVTMTLYVNGVQNATGTTSPAGAATGNTLEIGSANVHTDLFPGTIDDVRVYNRALSASDIMTLYTSTGGTSGDIYTGLAGYWKLDEASGTLAADSTGNGNTGTVTPNATGFWAAGKLNNAGNFNGTTQYVDITGNPPSLSFDSTNPFTLAAWIYRNSSADTDDEIMTKQHIGPAYGWSLWMMNNGGSSTYGGYGEPGCTSNCFEMQILGTSNQCGFIAANTPAAPGAWHHVVMTYDGSGSCSTSVNIYVDGVAQTTGNGHTNGTNSIGTLTYATDLLIGQDDPSLPADLFGGKIDDARVYNRALSASDVLTLYNVTASACASPVGWAGDEIYNNGAYHVPQYCNGSSWIKMGKVPGAGGAGCSSPAGSEGDTIYNKDYYALQYCDGTNWVVMGTRTLTGLLLWWNFDEGSGTSAADSSGQGNTGTLVNSPTWTTGKINGALTVNGTNQEVDSPSFTLGASRTFSFWLKVPSQSTANSTIFGWGPYCSCAVNPGNITHTMGCDLNGDYAYGASNTSTVDDNQWHFIAYTAVNGSQIIYFDGVQQGTATEGSASDTRPLSVGVLPFGGYGSGTIDDVRVYNRALSAGEIAHLYNGGP